jgi:hypothetical protein
MRLSPKLRGAMLIVALAATLGAVHWADSLPDATETKHGARADSRSHVTRDKPSSAPSTALDLQKLQRRPQSEPESDPFGTRDFTPPPPPKPKREASAGGPGAMQAPAPPPPQAPPLPFTYMGRLDEDQDTTVFLTAGDRNLVVKPGDVIDNTYKLEQVTQSSVVLTYLPMNQKQTLAIGTP